MHTAITIWPATLQVRRYGVCMVLTDPARRRRKDVSESTAYPSGWSERVGAFAAAVSRTVEEVTVALSSVVGSPGEAALAVLADVEASPYEDLKAALASLSIPSGVLRKSVQFLRGATKPAEATTPTVSAGSSMQALAILPAVPDEPSFLEMLKTGGVLKVDTTEVISAVKAALARGVGLFDLPERILDKMESFAEAQEEPCGEAFYRLQKLLTSRNYGEVLSVLGVPGNYVSDRRKKEFFARLDAKLWSALFGFQKQLTGWQQAWMQGMANPGMLMLAMTTHQTGGVMPPGMMQPPDTMPLRAAAEEVVNELNRIFAGPGIPVARALAWDATRIMGVLEDSSLPTQVGATTKDQMLKELGISVGAEIVRTEQSVTRYALAVMSISKVTADAELAYLAAMIQLGATIPWDKLGGDANPPRRTGIGKERL